MFFFCRGKNQAVRTNVSICQLASHKRLRQGTMEGMGCEKWGAPYDGRFLMLDQQIILFRCWQRLVVLAVVFNAVFQPWCLEMFLGDWTWCSPKVGGNTGLHITCVRLSYLLLCAATLLWLPLPASPASLCPFGAHKAAFQLTTSILTISFALHCTIQCNSMRSEL